MKDMMMEIYTALCADQLISENVTKERIKFYEAPETLDVSKPFIIIDALSPQTSANFAANKVVSKQFSYQINVETPDRVLTKRISRSVSYIMRNLDFGQLNGGLDTYFKDTKRYVDARRYRKNTRTHDTDY